MSNRIIVRAQGESPAPPPIPDPLPVIPVAAGTSVVTRVPAAIASTTLLAANGARIQASIFNDSASATLYLKLGATASPVSYTVQLQPLAYYELPARYTGVIDGIWSAAVGAALVTELSP